MEKNNGKKIWLFSIFILLVGFSMYLINVYEEDEQINSNNEIVTKNIVQNYNDFYTVNSCVYRYLTYLQDDNKSALLKVLDDVFIKNNGINENNIYEYIAKYDGNLNFISKKMFEEKISENVFKFYVYGLIQKDIMDSLPEEIEADFVVVMDKNRKVFTIEPYNGDIFK